MYILSREGAEGIGMHNVNDMVVLISKPCHIPDIEAQVYIANCMYEECMCIII